MRAAKTGIVSFDDSAETDGKFEFLLGSQPGSTITSGAGNDTFHGGGSGTTMNGGGGNDTFAFGANFDGTDTIDGGAGTNVVQLTGDYSAGLTFGATSLQNIFQLDQHRGNSYDLTQKAGNDTAGNSLDVHGETLSSSESLTFDGSAVAGNLTLNGGAGDDTLTGGSGHNRFIGGAGADTMNAGSSIDNFVYTAVSQSTSAGYDTINGFDTQHDHFVLPTAVSAVDSPVATGALSTATFNGDLARDIGSAQLGAHHAVEFTASSGSLAGDTFLIVDAYGVAGYQGGQDFVIEIGKAIHIADLSTANFTVGWSFAIVPRYARLMTNQPGVFLPQREVVASISCLVLQPDRHIHRRQIAAVRAPRCQRIHRRRMRMANRDHHAVAPRDGFGLRQRRRDRDRRLHLVQEHVPPRARDAERARERHDRGVGRGARIQEEQPPVRQHLHHRHQRHMIGREAAALVIVDPRKSRHPRQCPIQPPRDLRGRQRRQQRIRPWIRRAIRLHRHMDQHLMPRRVPPRAPMPASSRGTAGTTGSRRAAARWRGASPSRRHPDRR